MTAPKILQNNASGRGLTGLQTISSNDSTADKIPATTTGGFLSPTFFQESGIYTLPVSEAILAGSQVNVWDDSGTLKVRNASGPANLEAHGYAPSAIPSGSGQIIFQDGAINPAITTPTLVVGKDYYVGAAGVVTDTPPTTNMKQYVGTAISTSLLKQSWDIPVFLGT